MSKRAAKLTAASGGVVPPVVKKSRSSPMKESIPEAVAVLKKLRSSPRKESIPEAVAKSVVIPTSAPAAQPQVEPKVETAAPNGEREHGVLLII